MSRSQLSHDLAEQTREDPSLPRTGTQICEERIDPRDGEVVRWLPCELPQPCRGTEVFRWDVMVSGHLIDGRSDRRPAGSLLRMVTLPGAGVGDR